MTLEYAPKQTRRHWRRARKSAARERFALRKLTPEQHVAAVRARLSWLLSTDRSTPCPK